MATKKQKQEERLEEIREIALKNYKSIVKRKKTLNKWLRLTAQADDDSNSMVQRLVIMNEMQEMVFGEVYDEVLDLIEDAEDFDQFYIDIVNDESLKK